jgi:iron complex outermembrane receptor protein
MNVRLLVGGLALALALPASLQAAQASQPAQTPQAPPAEASQNPDEPVSYEEQVVVSASRATEELVNAPAAVTVVTSETIQNSPATNIGDLLRAVPGINVSQISARDVNLTTRGATSSLATSQLALVDGRSVYLDFFGMVLWDLVPTNPDDIRQIEVIRGPASAVWGANAMTGVINVLTKSPRELAAQGGNSLTIGVGSFDRHVTGRDQDAGTLFYVNGSHAQAIDRRWSYKVAAGFLTQDPLPRPTGTIANAAMTPYPSFANQGTSQPKFDGRVDYEIDGGGTVTVSGGVAGTEGIIHSGIGPFNISDSSRLGYLSTRWTRGGSRVAFFTNMLDGDASNLLTVGADRQPLELVFKTKTYDIEAGDVRTLAARHVFSYGANYRRNNFDISLAPSGRSRDEVGTYLQDEIFLSNHFRWVVGGRLDKISSIDDAVFSPRTTLMIKPAASQTFRLSFNRAFRAPSLINTNLDTAVLTSVVLPVPGVGNLPFAFATEAVGAPDLKQETMTAYEVGYTGVVANHATLTASVYWNNTDDAIYFTPVEAYSPARPPAGWPLPPQFVPPGMLPSKFTYLNLGTVKDKGVEVGVDAAVNQYVNVFTNYSYQWKPVAAASIINDINWPAKNRFNAGFNFTYSRFLGNLALNYTDSAYWQDVLDARFAGTTEAFTLLNGGVGVRWADGRITTSVKGTNLANQEVMQHIFGDVLKRQVVGEVRFRF